MKKMIKKDILVKKILGVVLIIISVSFGFLWGLGSGVLWFLFFSFALYDWNNRIVGVLALISLASCPFLLQFKQDALAEQMAVYAFFLLTITVMLQFIESKRFPERFLEDKQK